MLEIGIVEEAQETVLRLASTLQEPLSAVLLRRGVDPANVEAITAALAGVEMPLTVGEIVDHAFRARDGMPNPFPVGRFGGGTMGVYYSAIEELTCERELACHLITEFAEMENGTFSHRRFYNLIHCRYSGTTADLRGQEVAYPDLVSKTEGGYPFCQLLGLRAVEHGIDGFLTASARNDGGSCVPVFARSALSEPRIRYEITLTATSGGVMFQRGRLG